MYVLTKDLDKIGLETSGGEQRCIHTDDWDTIIRNARVNPWVYEKCLKNRCTKTVGIRFPAGSALYSEIGNKYTGIVTANEDGSHTVKYAVCIYGIRQDKGEDGDLIGLTFGPATGDGYTDGYRCHLESESTVVTAGIGSGDGASVLHDSIRLPFLRWNRKSSNRGGWPASRVRATLNGKDGRLDASVAGDDCPDTADALISCFPAALRWGIVPKAVVSDTEQDERKSISYTVTTYDRLWLFSGAEMYQDGGWCNNVIRPHEAVGSRKEPYDRSVKMGISTLAGHTRNMGCAESGYPALRWTRTLSRKGSLSDGVCYVLTDGDWLNNQPDGICGLAPGFCVG